MSSNDPFRPITTSRRLAVPKNYRQWSTTREFPANYPLPLIGSTMEAILGRGKDDDGLPWSLHRILDVQPGRMESGLRPITLTHGPIPGMNAAGAFASFTEYESYGYRFPPIYPSYPFPTAFFPGGSQMRARTVPARVVYEYAVEGGATFTGWRDAPTIWDYSTVTTGPFEVESQIAFYAAEDYEVPDGGTATIGQWLSPSFIAQDTINNAIGISIPGELAVTVPASRPSATTYAGWVANRTEFMAERSIFKWAGDIYGRRTVWIRAQ